VYVPQILAENPTVCLELKTKSAEIEWLKKIDVTERLILAWSVNPEKIVAAEENYSADLKARLSAAQNAQKMGFRIALHFDPIIYGPGWERVSGSN
jgi:spore photoproduct lyase